MTIGTWVLVGLIGGAGAVARYLVDGLVDERVGGVLPWGTLAVNLSGAVALGAVAGAAVSGNAYVLAGTAALGSYTTLSTWMLESHRLAQDERVLFALVNLLGSLLLGFAAIAAGHALGAAL
ncbi:MAG: fluoride efflux transporter CrcB [Solirubrobacteraceae bacterium]